jgi:hypothetical protein
VLCQRHHRRVRDVFALGQVLNTTEFTKAVILGDIEQLFGFDTVRGWFAI